MSNSRLGAAFGLSIALVLLSGCAAKAVSDANRDTTGSFDGEWQVLGQKSPAIQHINNWQFHCNSEPFEFRIRVAKGKAYFGGVSGSGQKITNVGKDGEFTFIVPLDTKAKESGSSARSITNGNRRVFFKGNLSNNSLKGSYTVGVQQFAWQGCRSKVKFEKSS